MNSKEKKNRGFCNLIQDVSCVGLEFVIKSDNFQMCDSPFHTINESMHVSNCTYGTKKTIGAHIHVCQINVQPDDAWW